MKPTLLRLGEFSRGKHPAQLQVASLFILPSQFRLWTRNMRFLSDNVLSFFLSKRPSPKVISFLLSLPQQGMEILETDCLRSNPGPTRHVVLHELVNLSLSLGFLIIKGDN